MPKLVTSGGNRVITANPVVPFSRSYGSLRKIVSFANGLNGTRAVPFNSWRSYGSVSKPPVVSSRPSLGFRRAPMRPMDQNMDDDMYVGQGVYDKYDIRRAAYKSVGPLKKMDSHQRNQRMVKVGVKDPPLPKYDYKGKYFPLTDIYVLQHTKSSHAHACLVVKEGGKDFIFNVNDDLTGMSQKDGWARIEGVRPMMIRKKCIHEHKIGCCQLLCHAMFVLYREKFGGNLSKFSKYMCDRKLTEAGLILEANKY